MRRHWAVLSLVLSLSLSCKRVAEPAQPVEARSAEPVPTTAEPAAPGSAAEPASSAPAQAVTPPSERCLVPTPQSPPPPASPAAQCPTAPGPPPEMQRGALRFVEATDAPRLTLELARTDPQRNHGLMYRTTLPEDHGMLFSWSDEQRRTFWMKNTCLPLDMLFIARDGTIAGILENVPVMNELPRTVACPAAHVLEVNAGFCRRHGVRAGMRVLFE